MQRGRNLVISGVAQSHLLIFVSISFSFFFCVFMQKLLFYNFSNGLIGEVLSVKNRLSSIQDVGLSLLQDALFPMLATDLVVTALQLE